MTSDTGRPSPKARSGWWQVAQLTLAMVAKPSSKKMARPSRAARSSSAYRFPRAGGSASGSRKPAIS
jgi:hypothetical protein